MEERPEGLNLPSAGVITRTIQEALPESVSLSKEARSAISRAASVFVLYTTSCANNFAMKGKRKTTRCRREQKGKKEASEQKKDKVKKTDSEEQDRSRDEDNDEDEERMEEEQNEEDEVDN
ncbi:DNA polymerase epsilon subunit 3 [Heterocephalus glaber]|uniref:DNA polymerase epsilon subunit 3 n=1 Tax=Heterocephalus glaber TaxID=10181 RepID=G5B7R8_HETGA|nr:DNA polymerase epsilon subunit 3 [Heterocephalus glaber]